MAKESVHGFWVEFEEKDRDGIRYLRDDLQYKEAKSLFDAARLTGSAEFEDDYDRDWSLIYNHDVGTFTLIRRERE